MITVKKLKEELKKFSDECVCFAYEGEVIGLVIEYPSTKPRHQRKQGVIYCSESTDKEPETEVIQ